MNEKNMMEAFMIYQDLSSKGVVSKDEVPGYMDESVRGIITEFAEAMGTTILSAGDHIYLIPLTVNSDYHITNQEIKDKYLPARATNMDIYLLYVAIIIFIGEFYDSYQTQQATRDFLTVDGWMQSLDERIQGLKQMDEESLELLEQEYEYNWNGIIAQWDSIDIIKEDVKKQTARTVSRKSFMMIAAKFMIEQGLAREIGEEELELTEKTKVIVQWFFMDFEYNRGIMEVIYKFSEYEEFRGEDTGNADNIQN